ncbi:uncharacterized protein LOC135817273 isoform X2 [Sycon ciliatum]|uniref:uncharacterized protein LOC135817273 isoform X2 n=1 Tax=Sycon ciliatum TaxID=27933 RepID=UPI0031F6B244
MQRMRRKHSYGAGSRYCTTSWYGALRSAMCNRNYHGDTADHRVKRCEMQQSIRRFDRRPGDKRGADRRSLQCPSWFGAAPSADVGTWLPQGVPLLPSASTSPPISLSSALRAFCIQHDFPKENVLAH